MNNKILVGFLFLHVIGPVFSRDITTLDGTTYKNVKILNVTPVGFDIDYKDGVKELFFKNLPENIREEFNYDPRKAREYEKNRRRRHREWERKRREKAREERKRRFQRENDQLKRQDNALQKEQRSLRYNNDRSIQLPDYDDGPIHVDDGYYGGVYRHGNLQVIDGGYYPHSLEYNRGGMRHVFQYGGDPYLLRGGGGGFHHGLQNRVFSHAHLGVGPVRARVGGMGIRR